MENSIKVWVNGFGRIGRLAARIMQEEEHIELVGINGRTKPDSHAHLLKYDSIYWNWKEEVSNDVENIIINGKKIKVFQKNAPEDIDWWSVWADIIIESSGKFTSRDTAQWHLKQWPKGVIISAPGKNVDATFVKWVNHNEFDPKSHQVVSNASCTTTCLATIAKILDETYQIISWIMVTTHAVTWDQNIVDSSHKDLRRARAAYSSMVPSSTWAAKAIGQVLPNLKWKLIGSAIRVPTDTVSLVTLTANTKNKPESLEKLNNLFKQNESKYLEYNDKKLVSVDFKWNPHSAIFDPTMTQLTPDGMLSISAWYDNELGYAQRLVEMARYMGQKINNTL